MKVKDLNLVLEYYNEDAEVLIEQRSEKDGRDYHLVQIVEYLDSEGQIERNSLHLTAGELTSS